MISYVIFSVITIGVLWYILTIPAVIDFWKKYRTRIFWALLMSIIGIVLLRVMPIVAGLLWTLSAAILGGGARIIQFVSMIQFLKRWTKKEQQTQQQSSASHSQEMTVKEACSILNVSADASRDAINHAYHQAMKRNHPDHGGSEYFALRINLARDILLGKKS